MRTFFRDLPEYLKAVFIDGQQRLFTLFDLLGVVLLIWPNLAEALVEDVRLARIIGGVFVLLSFVLANFAVYRRLSALSSSMIGINSESLLMYPYANPPYNSIEMRFVGEETVKDLSVKMIYKDKNGVETEKDVVQFFPDNDLRMAISAYRLYTLIPGQIARFHLLKAESTLDKKVRIVAEFTGTRSGKHIRLIQEFSFDDIPPQIF